MILNFIDRKNELELLEERYASDNPEFIIIYGRRRIGKTELIKRFSREKDHFYFLAKEQNIELEIERLRDRFSRKSNIHLEKTSSIEDLFREISAKIEQDIKFVFIIDEFPFWISKHKAILSDFQHLWDEFLSTRNIMLILTGSSVSIMETEVLGYKSPLYGRRTGQLKIEPMKFEFLKDFLPAYSTEDIIRIYGAVGGVPFYLKEMRDDMTFPENIKNTFFNKLNILHQEAEILLREELREVHVYFNILTAINEGSTKLGEISSKARVSITNINKYLNVLLNLRLIKKEYPVLLSPKTKNFIYRLDDNYFRFYLKYVYPYREEIEEDVDLAVKLMEDDYPRFMGEVFEDVCRKNLRRMNIPVFRSPGTKIGRWWHKDKEIDIAALNEDTKEIAFFECKWKDLSRGEVLKIIEELKEKAGYVRWNNNERKEYYGVIAKKIEGKDTLRLDGYPAFDLRDF